tara:strand:+ start:1431 stop:1919 length:489 start_codon:yes stop_codon:yes gene_type:complete
MARPSKFTDIVREKIIQSIGQGVTPEVAAELHGVSSRTFYEWMQKGREGEEGFSQFSQDVTHAKRRMRSLIERKIAITNPTFFASRSPLMREREGMEGWHGFEKNDINVQIVTVSSIVDGARKQLQEQGKDFDVLALPELTEEIKYIGDNGSSNNGTNTDDS